MKKTYIYIIIGALVVICLGSLVYLKTKNPAVAEANKQESTKAEKDEIVSKLSKIMMLPTGDEPVLIKIDNAQQLISQQAFFQGSQDGDVVLIYPKTNRAIIYSPSRNMVINSGPIQTQATENKVETKKSEEEVATSTKTTTKKK